MSESNKRVSIKYSIDLETLPEEVMRLIKRSNRDAKQALNTYESFNYTNVLNEKSLQHLQELRISLTKADAALEDVNSIISGYLDMRSPAPIEAHTAAPETPQVATHREVPPPPYNPSAKRAPMMSNRPVGAPSLPAGNPFAGNGRGNSPPPFSLEQLQKTVKTVTDSMEGDDSTDIQARLKKISEVLKNENTTENTDKTV
jgi:hypothetical protein